MAGSEDKFGAGTLPKHDFLKKDSDVGAKLAPKLVKKLDTSRTKSNPKRTLSSMSSLEGNFDITSHTRNLLKCIKINGFLSVLLVREFDASYNLK